MIRALCLFVSHLIFAAPSFAAVLEFDRDYFDDCEVLSGVQGEEPATGPMELLDHSGCEAWHVVVDVRYVSSWSARSEVAAPAGLPAEPALPEAPGTFFDLSR